MVITQLIIKLVKLTTSVYNERYAISRRSFRLVKIEHEGERVTKYGKYFHQVKQLAPHFVKYGSK